MISLLVHLGTIKMIFGGVQLGKKNGVYKLGPMPTFFKGGCPGNNSRSMNCVHLKSTI